MLICLGKMRDSGLCRLLSKNILQYDKKSIFALGIIIGLSPCAPLLAIFSYLALVAKTWFLALLYSLFFGLGTFFSALLFFPLLAATTQQFLFLKKPILAKILSFGSGLILIFLGISMLTKFF
jgi:ABC-type nickel/cobalt efflux system permease component RcnA